MTKGNIAYPGTQAQADAVEVRARDMATEQGVVHGDNIRQSGASSRSAALATSGATYTVAPASPGLRGVS